MNAVKPLALVLPAFTALDRPALAGRMPATPARLAPQP